MFELTNIQNWEILTRTPSSTSKMQLLHLHLGEEVHVEAMYSSSLHSGSSDDVALLVQHPSHVFERLGIPVGEDDEVGDDACFGCRFVCTYSRIFHNFRVVSYGVSPYLLKCPRCPRGFLFCLLDISRNC